MSPLPQSPQNSSSRLPPGYDSPVQKHVHSQAIPGQSPHEMHSLNMHLAEELKSVVLMNDQWQKYHKDQEKYVKDQQTRIDHQRLKIQELEGKFSQALTDKHQLEQKTRDQQSTIDSFRYLMEDLDKAQNELRILKLREQDLQDELRIFKELPHTGDGRSENIEMLQLQVQVCIDDFKKERKEKEKYQNKATVLLGKLETAQNLLEDYQEKIIMMRSINFPNIQEDRQIHAAAIPNDRTGYSRRNRIPRTTHSSQGGCRIDYHPINCPSFPVEVDGPGSYPKAQTVALAACFPSLDSDNFEDGLGSDGTLGERNVELVRH